MGKKRLQNTTSFSCFCKEQADDKLYAIEKSTAKIDELDAEITDLDALIADLASEIALLTKKISRITAKVEEITEEREKDHASYLEKEADASNAISAIKRAIAAMKESKTNLEGKVDLDLLERTMARFSISTAELALLKNNKPGEAFQYEYHSNDIIATLESLLDKFTEIKNRLDMEEFKPQADLPNAWQTAWSQQHGQYYYWCEPSHLKWAGHLARTRLEPGHGQRWESAQRPTPGFMPEG